MAASQWYSITRPLVIKKRKTKARGRSTRGISMFLYAPHYEYWRALRWYKKRMPLSPAWSWRIFRGAYHNIHGKNKIPCRGWPSYGVQQPSESWRLRHKRANYFTIAQPRGAKTQWCDNGMVYLRWVNQVLLFIRWSIKVKTLQSTMYNT